VIEALELPYAVLLVLEAENNIVDIFDYMVFPNNMPAQQLICINRHGQVLWVAKSPSVPNTSAYTNFTRSTNNVLSNSSQ
jgi:hypothetical protein